MKKAKKINKYQVSIITLLVAGCILIAGVWIWFERKNNELDDQLRNNKHGSARPYTVNT